MNRLILITCLSVVATGQQIPLDWRTGTLTRVASGQEYLGTYAAASGSTGIARVITLPIVRSDQVYVIVGGGMEYIVTESGRAPAHVIVNAPILYAIERDKFYFGDQEGRPHPARIARQTLVDPGAVSIVQPRTWRSVTGERYFVRRSENSLAELLVTKRKQTPVRFEAKWSGDQFIGQMHWSEGKCALTTEVNLKASSERIEGHMLAPIVGPASARLHAVRLGAAVLATAASSAARGPIHACGHRTYMRSAERGETTTLSSLRLVRGR